MAVNLHEDKAGVEEMHEQTRDVTDLEKRKQWALVKLGKGEVGTVILNRQGTVQRWKK